MVLLYAITVVPSSLDLAVGAEGRIAHLLRAYRASRSRPRGAEGAATWENWAVLAYNVDTAAALAQTTQLSQASRSRTR